LGNLILYQIPGVGTPHPQHNEDRYKPTGEIIDQSYGLGVVSSILDELVEEGDAVMEPEEQVNNSEGMLVLT